MDGIQIVPRWATNIYFNCATVEVSEKKKTLKKWSTRFSCIKLTNKRTSPGWKFRKFGASRSSLQREVPSRNQDLALKDL